MDHGGSRGHGVGGAAGGGGDDEACGEVVSGGEWWCCGGGKKEGQTMMGKKECDVKYGFKQWGKNIYMG